MKYQFRTMPLWMATGDLSDYYRYEWVDGKDYWKVAVDTSTGIAYTYCANRNFTFDGYEDEPTPLLIKELC